jgi:uncharacterized protein (DUF1330 family)
MENKTTLVVTAIPNPNEMESVQEYLQAVLPIFMGAGGRLVKRLKLDKVILGDSSGMVLVMDFDSAAAVTAMFESDEYKALIPTRDRGFIEMNILLTNEM